MRLQTDQFWNYSEWLFTHSGLMNGVILAVVLAIAGFVVSYLVALARSGPTEGFYVVAKTISDLFMFDLPGTSWQRIVAIGRLAFKEAIRRKVLALIVIFVFVMMFAGWYLDSGAEEPAKLYISVVLQFTNVMALLLGLFLSCFSLPAEIKSKTIYSIVTKPVRPTEIIIGRVLGFGAVGTLILVCLGFLSYLFVVRGVEHVHDVAEFTAEGLPLETTKDAFHKHTFEFKKSGAIQTSEAKGHSHDVIVSEVDGKKKYRIGPAKALVARVPIYTKGLRFSDGNGNASDGINVGYESEYQKYVEGNTKSSAVWTFEGVTPEAFPNGLNIEMTLAAFRTYKGDIEKGIQGVIFFRKPGASQREAEDVKNDVTLPHRFEVKEFQTQRLGPDDGFTRKMKGFKNNELQELDLFEDLAPDGRLEVIVRCIDQGQYLGMAPADLFLRAGDASFFWNFVKGYIGIWLQMMIIICFGVMFSTFLSGPVAMVATISCLVIGFFGSIPTDILKGTMVGGGPIESMIRIPTQLGVMAELDLGNEGLVNSIRAVDRNIIQVMVIVVSGLPDFGSLGTVDFVAYGINIFNPLLLRHITIAFGYFLLTTIVGYFFLKTREMAA